MIVVVQRTITVVVHCDALIVDSGAFGKQAFFLSIEFTLSLFSSSPSNFSRYTTVFLLNLMRLTEVAKAGRG